MDIIVVLAFINMVMNFVMTMHMRSNPSFVPDDPNCAESVKDAKANRNLHKVGNIICLIASFAIMVIIGIIS